MIEAVVGRQIDAYAIHGQRHAPAIEAAHEHVALVAPAAVVGHGHARRQGGRLVERVGVEGPHGLVADRGAADHVELTERENAGCAVRCC